MDFRRGDKLLIVGEDSYCTLISILFERYHVVNNGKKCYIVKRENIIGKQEELL